MKAVRMVLLILAVTASISCAGGRGYSDSSNDQPMTAFPPPGVDVVTHDLTIELHRITAGADGRLPDPCQAAEAVGAKSELLENLVFGGRMIIERSAVTTDNEGRSRQPFVVQSWSANAYSKALNTSIQYVLSPDVKQPESSITSEKRGSAFPVTFDFNVIFDAYANGRLVRPRHHGRPKGYGFLVIPPNGNRALSPTITEFETCFVDVPDPEGGGRVLFRFRPKNCNDQSGETVATLAQARP